MEQAAIEKVRQIKALLAAITGSQGTDEMGDELGPYLDACHALAADALALLQPAATA